MNKSEFKLLLRFTRFILVYRSRWLAMALLSGLTTLLGLVNPYLTKLVIDNFLGDKDLGLYLILALIGASIFVLNGLISGMVQFLDKNIKLKLGFDLNKRVFKHMQSFPLAWFQDKSTGENIYRVNYDIDRVTSFMTTVPPQAAAFFPKILFTLALVFYLNWRMAVLSFILAPLMYLPPYYFRERLRLIFEAITDSSSDVFVAMQEIFSHIHLVKVFGKETSSTRNYLRRLIARIRAEIRKTRLEIFTFFTAQAVNKIVLGVITLYGGYQVIKGRLSLGSMTAIMIYLNQLLGLQGHFAYLFQTAVSGLVSCRRLAEILDAKPQIIPPVNARKVVFKKAEIDFADISFGYRQQEYVLQDINLRIEGGRHIAISGPSGCGKSTLLYLLLRLYAPWRGGIFIDGYDIRGLEETSFREQIGVALQEPYLWNDSVENNIRYAKEKATKSEIIEVARIAGVDDFVKGLPRGYETIIGENACKLSQGQKQKIAIARALLKKPRILILDEAMSSMDSPSEERVLLNIKQAHPDMTLIVVSHRLSTILSANLVYYFAGPDKIIVDTTSRLLENNRSFFELFTNQNQISV